MTVYEIITNQILEELKKGSVPWHKPWNSEYPKNLITKKEYRGINVFLLGCQKFSSPFWVSYDQAKILGGNVKYKEKSTMIVFWKQVTVADNDNETKTKTIPFLRYYRIFNIEQCEGIDEKKIPVTEVNPNFQPLTECEKTINSMQNKPEIRHQESQAYYQPKDDFVNMPKPETFIKEEFYYSVMFHELGHSTGHKSRLERKDFDQAAFGSQTYSKEELCAEMTAAFLCGHHHIEQQTIENSAAYIKSWLHKLQDDPKMVVLAAAQAQKAADYILNKNI